MAQSLLVVPNHVPTPAVVTLPNEYPSVLPPKYMLVFIGGGQTVMISGLYANPSALPPKYILVFNWGGQTVLMSGLKAKPSELPPK